MAVESPGLRGMEDIEESPAGSNNAAAPLADSGGMTAPLADSGGVAARMENPRASADEWKWIAAPFSLATWSTIASAPR